MNAQELTQIAILQQRIDDLYQRPPNAGREQLLTMLAFELNALRARRQQEIAERSLSIFQTLYRTDRAQLMKPGCNVVIEVRRDVTGGSDIQCVWNTAANCERAAQFYVDLMPQPLTRLGKPGDPAMSIEVMQTKVF